jgi:hypothetical protein
VSSGTIAIVLIAVAYVSFWARDVIRKERDGKTEGRGRDRLWDCW